jgi:hypothetical protein
MSEQTFERNAFDEEAFDAPQAGKGFDGAAFGADAFDAVPAQSIAFSGFGFDVSAFDASLPTPVHVIAAGELAPLAGSVKAAVVFVGTASAVLAPLGGSVALSYASRTQRPIVGQVGSAFQDGAAHATGVASNYRDARRTVSAATSPYEDAVRVSVGVKARHQDADRLRSPSAVPFQDARAVQRSIQERERDAIRIEHARWIRFRDSVRLHVRETEDRFQSGLRLRSQSAIRYQHAIRSSGAQAGVRFQLGSLIHVSRSTRYQDATSLPIGGWVDEGEGGEIDPGPGPIARVIVPLRRVYLVENHITLHRVDTGATIEADAFSMSLDVDSWTWAWSASLPASALALIEPGGDGDPVDIETMVNGVAFRLCAESYSRERSFGKARIRVQGRGRGAILDAPYAPTLNHFSAGALTAQQLAALALTINGVGIGWDVAWGLEDWSVPGGTWNVQGSYIAAVQDIVQAAGGYVQPHRTAATLRVLPRYPATPWTWNALTPDFELPSAVASVESIEWRSLPAYDRIFISGTRSDVGVLGQVTRAGTAGGAIAPMVTHPLITNAIAARQRGLAELSNTGRQALVTLRMPVLADTGIIQPGALVRYVDGPTTRLGLVRSTSVSWDRPVLRQTIGLETHVD